MGRAENIKRAKKLKEAKNKKIQATLNTIGLGPGSNKIIKRNIEKGFKTEINRSEVQYSALLKGFVIPILSENDNLTVIKAKYYFAQIAWNAATMREKNDDFYKTAKEELKNKTWNDEEIDALFDEMVKIKEVEYSEHKFIYTDFEIKSVGSKGGYHLTVGVTPIEI